LTLAATVDMRHALEAHAEVLRSDEYYLGRCQHDTPAHVVALVWRQVHARRSHVDRVVDFGAGDARFSRLGGYGSYVGYELDPTRCPTTVTGDVQIIHGCAFSHASRDADVCVGNPPYVRNQDLPLGWRHMAAAEVEKRTGVAVSGIANAWQYFLMLSLWSTKDDGLVALVLPYEWATRPAARAIRNFIDAQGWGVDVVRLPDGTFQGVLTAASVTVIDKRGPAGWRFHSASADGAVKRVPTATGHADDVLPYVPVRGATAPRAKRGLSPGTQRVLTLTEEERLENRLHEGPDVVPCVTSLRKLPVGVTELNRKAFDKYFIERGEKCWLIRTDIEPSSRLRQYLDSVDEHLYQTATCKSRDEWWRFTMPSAPVAVIAQAFKGSCPKAALNDVRAVAVGGVAGLHHVERSDAERFLHYVATSNVEARVVAYAKQMHKLEINQLNTLLTEFARGGTRDD